MKILLIDDHVSFCEGLKSAILAASDEYQVEFDASAEWIPDALMASNDYDLLIIDLMMPGMGGIELLRYLQQSHNPTPVMVLSSVEDPAVIRHVIELGAIAYLPKSYSVYQILDAIEGCRQGQIHLPRHLMAGALDTDTETVADSSLVGGLTRRQLEIAGLMEKGLSNQEIADQLCISKATVKTHVNHMFKNFNVSNRISCLRAIKERQREKSVSD